MKDYFMRLLSAIAAVVLLVVAPARSQSPPNPAFYFNYQPTAGQWNLYFQQKQDVLGFTPLNQAGGTVTGRLITTASSGTGSGFRLLPGTAPGSPVDGDVWLTSAGMFARINGATVGPFAAGSSSAAFGLLPVQTSTSASYVFGAADLYWETRRSNGGVAMTDTLPPAATVGLVNGTTLQINNADTTATLTVSPGAGTTIPASGAIGPGRSTRWVYDAPAATWRPTMNSLTSLLSNQVGVGLLLSGIGPGQLTIANPSATTLGGVESVSPVAHQWISSIDTSGVPALTQPAFSDLSGTPTTLAGYGITSPLGITEGGTGLATLTANAPLLGNGTSPVTLGTLTGNTTKLATSTGALTSGHCVSWDANFNLVDAGVVCGGTGTGGVTTFNGRAGTVVPAASDYTFAQLASIPTTLAGYGITSPLNVAQGGTAATTLAAHAVLLGEGTSAVATAAIGTAGRILIDQGAGVDPVWRVVSGATLSSTGALSVTATPPAGSSTQLQYNNSGAFGANSGFVVDTTSYAKAVMKAQSPTTYTGCGNNAVVQINPDWTPGYYGTGSISSLICYVLPITADAGQGGIVIADRSLNDTGAGSNSIAIYTLAIDDNTTFQDGAWAYYGEGHRYHSINYAFGIEIAMVNRDPTVASWDPYGCTGGGLNCSGVTAAQVDCGDSLPSTLVVYYSCSIGFAIVNNGGTGQTNDRGFESGIFFGPNSIDQTLHFPGRAIQLPVNDAIAWWHAAGNADWQIYSAATATSGSIVLGTNIWSVIAPSGVIALKHNVSSGVLAVGLQNGDYIQMGGTATGGQEVFLNAIGATDAAVGIFLQAKGAAPVEVVSATVAGNAFAVANIPGGFSTFNVSTSANTIAVTNAAHVCTFTPNSTMVASCTSDARLKTDIVDVGDVLPWLSSMRVRNYRMLANGEANTGVVAQELLPYAPDMVHVGDAGTYMVDSPNPWKMVRAMQELKADNDNLRSELDRINRLLTEGKR